MSPLEHWCEKFPLYHNYCIMSVRLVKSKLNDVKVDSSSWLFVKSCRVVFSAFANAVVI